MKKQIKELEGHKHSLEKKIDEGLSVWKVDFSIIIYVSFHTEAEFFKVSLKIKEEEIDRYELKLREESEKNTEIKAQLLTLEKGEWELSYRTILE